MQLAICRNNFYQLQRATCSVLRAACNTRNSQLLMVNTKSLCNTFSAASAAAATNNKFNLIFNCRPKGGGVLIK